MINKIYNSIVMAALIIALGIAGTAAATAAEPGARSKLPGFTLNDYNGKSHSFSNFKESKAVVILYVATRCPVSNAYNKRMNDLHKEFKAKNIAFVGINSNKMEDAAEVKKHAKESGLTFPILKDIGNVVADTFEASVTPEVYVANKDGELLYHGRIDDSRRESGVTSRDLHNALTEILAGKAVSVKETKAFGCSVKRVKK
ncbi:MAG: thioredoxin family protein [bacterium]|nr:thioredoxin family protein [bacterium]